MQQPVPAHALSLSHAGNLPLLVLDVNGVTCRKVYDRERQLASAADGYTPSGQALFKRPGLDDFLSRVQSCGWRIAFWSSAVRGTIDAIRSELFPRIRPVVVLSHEVSPQDSVFVKIRAGRNWAILKDLRMLWDATALRCGPESTVIVDDSCLKVRLQPENAVLVPPFEVDTATGEVGEEQEARERGTLRTLAALLERAAAAGDVRKVLRKQADEMCVRMRDEDGGLTTCVAALPGAKFAISGGSSEHRTAHLSGRDNT